MQTCHFSVTFSPPEFVNQKYIKNKLSDPQNAAHAIQEDSIHPLQGTVVAALSYPCYPPRVHRKYATGISVLLLGFLDWDSPLSFNNNKGFIVIPSLFSFKLGEFGRIRSRSRSLSGFRRRNCQSIGLSGRLHFPQRASPTFPVVERLPPGGGPVPIPIQGHVGGLLLHLQVCPVSHRLYFH